MQRIFLTMNGSPNWHIWVQYSICCPYSTAVYKGKVQIYFPKSEKLMPLEEKFECWAVSKNDFSPFQYLNESLSEDSEVEDTAEIKELVLEHF